MTPEDLGHFKELFVGIDLTRRSAAVYNLVFLVRRMLFVLTAVLEHSRPDFQILALLLLTLMNLLYLVSVKPFEDSTVQKNEVMNEHLVYSSVVLSLLLLIFQNDSEVQNKIGWVLFAQIVGNIALNMVFAFKESCIYNLRRLRATLRTYKEKMRRWDEIRCTCQCSFCGVS